MSNGTTMETTVSKGVSIDRAKQRREEALSEDKISGTEKRFRKIVSTYVFVIDVFRAGEHITIRLTCP